MRRMIDLPDELAERLKTSRSWVSEMTRNRQRNPIPHYKIGRYLRFHWPDVCAWMEETAKVVGTEKKEEGKRNWRAEVVGPRQSGNINRAFAWRDAA